MATCPSIIRSARLKKKPANFAPTGIAVVPDGRIFVADGYGRNYIHIYKPDGTYVKTFGGSGCGLSSGSMVSR